jgi:hypothetical protein
MEKLPLHKVKNIMEFWSELTLPEEMRVKRMRKEADKAAQEFHDKLFSGKIEKEELRVEKKTDKPNPNEDPKTLDRFLDFMGGIDPNLLTTNTTTNEKGKEND